MHPCPLKWLLRHSVLHDFIHSLTLTVSLYHSSGKGMDCQREWESHSPLDPSWPTPPLISLFPHNNDATVQLVTPCRLALDSCVPLDARDISSFRSTRETLTSMQHWERGKEDLCPARYPEHSICRMYITRLMTRSRYSVITNIWTDNWTQNDGIWVYVSRLFPDRGRRRGK